MTAGECAPAGAPQGASGQEYVLVTEQQEAAQAAEVRHRLWMRRLFTGVGAAAALGAGIFVWQRSGDAGLAREREEKIAVLSEGDKLSLQESAELSAMVQRLLAATDWKAWLPEVAAAAKVRPAMEWYYTTGGRSLEPDRLVALGDFQKSRTGREVLRLQVTTARQASVWLPLLKESGRWKLDWEAYSAVDRVRWAAFIHESAGAAVEVRLQAALKPGPEPYLVKARVPVKGFKVVNLWSYERTEMAAAILADSDPLWRSLTEASYESATKCIARVTMINPQADPPLVRIDSILQRGWVRE